MRERVYIQGVELLRLELDLLILVRCNGDFTGLPIAALLRRGHKMARELLHQLGSHLLTILGDDAGAILNLDDHFVGGVVAVEHEADLDAEVEKVVLSSADRARELVLVRADALDHRQEGRLRLADGMALVEQREETVVGVRQRDDLQRRALLVRGRVHRVRDLPRLDFAARVGFDAADEL